jgi:hypothetical protein
MVAFLLCSHRRYPFNIAEFPFSGFARFGLPMISSQGRLAFGAWPGSIWTTG